MSRLTCKAGRTRERAYIDAVATGTGPEFLAAFWAAKHALALASSAAFAEHGVHEGQQHVLRCLWAEDGLAPGEVARRLGLATPTVTRTAQRLEVAGFLRRQPHATDGRLVRLVLTPRGRHLETVIEHEMARLTETALAGFTPGERSALIETLGRLRRNLTRDP